MYCRVSQLWGVNPPPAARCRIQQPALCKGLNGTRGGLFGHAKPKSNLACRRQVAVVLTGNAQQVDPCLIEPRQIG